MSQETPVKLSSAAAAPSAKYPWRALLLLLLFTALVRGGVLWLMPYGLTQDPDDYRDIAQNLATEGQFAKGSWLPVNGTLVFAEPSLPYATATRAPLYPLVLSQYVRGGELPPRKIALVHLVLGLATVALAFHLAWLWRLEKLAALVGLLVACDPILLKQSTVIMTETLATFLAVVGLYALTRFHAAATPFNAGLVGGALALAELCRPVFLIWLVLCFLAMPFLGPNVRRRIVNVGAYVFVAVAVISPWAIRNYLQFGKPIVTTTLGGNTFILSNNNYFYEYLAKEKRFVTWSQHNLDSTTELLDQSDTSTAMWKSITDIRTASEPFELVLDRSYYANAFGRIRLEPGMFAYACLYRLRRLWGIWPYPTEDPEPRAKFWLRQATAAWYAAEWICALVGARTLGRRLFQSPWLWGTLLVVAVTGVHTFYWTDLRMRAPLMPFLALVAAVGVERIFTSARHFPLARRASEGRP